MNEIHNQQELERLDIQNTFRFFIDGNVGTDWVAPADKNPFSVNIINHEKGGIKDCKCRLRKIYLPKGSAEGPTGDTAVYLDCNFLQTSYPQ